MGVLDFLKKSTPITMSEVDLSKSVKPVIVNEQLAEQLEQSKIVFDLESKRVGIDNIQTKHARLSDKELKSLAQYDSVISLIVNTRANQAFSFGKKTRSKYQRGFILREIIPAQDDPSIPTNEKDAECRFRTQLSDVIASWVSTCGADSDEILEYVFDGSDSLFKRCSLQEYMSAQARNLLVFGRCATQIIRNKEGVPILWRPIPVETLYKVINGKVSRVSIAGNDDDINQAGAEDAAKYEAMPEAARPVAYVQRIEGKNVSFFTEDDLIIVHSQKQAYEGLEGYNMAPIELAYYTVLMHYNAQVHLQNAFVKGLGSKGIINLRTPEGATVSKNDVENFRKLFSNYVARNDNSATIPVISGPVEIQFIPLMATEKDMEFNKLYTNVVKILCASFQISPHEIGYGELDSDAASVSDGGKQESIVHGEERGLRQLIESILESVQAIVYEAFPQSKGVLKFEPIGLGQNTKEADLALYKEELQTSGTFAKIWSDSERSEAFPYGGHVPTSPIFHQNVAKYMKYGDFMYYFFGDRTAKQNPAYDFIVDPAMNEAYQSLKQQMPQLQRAQQELQLQGMQMQMQAGAQQPEQEAEQAQADETALIEAKAQKEADENRRKQEEHELKMQMEMEKHQMEMELEREKHESSLLAAYQEAQMRRELKQAENTQKIETMKLQQQAKALPVSADVASTEPQVQPNRSEGVHRIISSLRPR